MEHFRCRAVGRSLVEFVWKYKFAVLLTFGVLSEQASEISF